MFDIYLLRSTSFLSLSARISSFTMSVTAITIISSFDKLGASVKKKQKGLFYHHGSLQYQVYTHCTVVTVHQPITVNDTLKVTVVFKYFLLHFYVGLFQSRFNVMWHINIQTYRNIIKMNQ